MAVRRFKKVPNPNCPVHRCPMCVGSTQAQIRYYYCPHPKCSQSDKRARTEVSELKAESR